MKIVKFTLEEYGWLKQWLLGIHLYGHPDDANEAQLQVLLSKLDSAVVERDRSVLQEPTVPDPDMGKP